MEKKEGSFSHKGVQFKLVDLPGTYSLTAAAEDEWSLEILSLKKNLTWWLTLLTRLILNVIFTNNAVAGIGCKSSVSFEHG